ncbi:YiiX/YebB-like N1pC/P60 family cysteine hydrolase [Clostridium sp. E02]|uniref:YiiX/YebB-like N1pC/P60 family cysteine hydrolase n=1 Tax=Clostridium sp. E02 TaxID=2487134 RepID=UPI0013DE087F|nr:YiiX/YebB-like N1pC/P60 family cysteine hydrolase [Clostridium sp. E02]
MKKIKNLLSLFLVVLLVFGTNTLAFAQSEKADSILSEEKIVKAYENVVNYASVNNIPLDLSIETFTEEFESSNFTDLTEYENTYYKILVKQPTFATRSSGSSKWYYNTGTSLPQAANYSEYNLLNTLKRGDIIYESKGGFGITGHIAIVEGKYYSSTYQQYYIRVVEAISEGVVRSILDDSRIDDRNSSVLRVVGASETIASNAAKFCIGQLGKSYMIDFKKDTSPNEPDWYCSELVWAGYYNQGIDIETTGIYNEPGITPRDINNSSKVYNVNFR